MCGITGSYIREHYESGEAHALLIKSARYLCTSSGVQLPAERGWTSRVSPMSDSSAHESRSHSDEPELQSFKAETLASSEIRFGLRPLQTSCAVVPPCIVEVRGGEWSYAAGIFAETFCSSSLAGTSNKVPALKA